MSLMHLSAVDALKDFPNDPLLGVRTTILLRIDWPFCHLAALDQDCTIRAALQSSLVDEVQYDLFWFRFTHVDASA